MESAECSYEGCHNKARPGKTGLCRPHRRVQIREGKLRPLRPRQRIQSPVCTGPECSRPSDSHDLCKEHGSQLRKGQSLHVIGDPAFRSAAQLRRWERMTEQEKTDWMARMRAGIPAERTEQHIQRLSAANRKAWRDKLIGTERKCRTCGTGFELLNLNNWYCSADCRRLYTRISRHKLTVTQYWAMIEAQGDVCLICGRGWRGWNGKGPHIDHDHKTGRVRGLLCGECNTGIGRFGDDPALLRRAANYLERT